MEEVMPKAEATLKYARISSRKVKIVADLIRGKKIDEALISECHIQVRHPEYLLETIINLCKKYHELERQEEF